MGKSFHDLRVWQHAMDLVVQVYKASEGFPRAEIYGLTSQMRRASVSVPSNVAEGQARQSQKEFLRFLSTAKGSLAELSTQVLLAERLGYISEKQRAELIASCDSVGRLLSALHAAIEKRVQRAQPGTKNQEPGTI